MKRSNRLVIFVGVLLAILAFVGIVIVLNNGTGGSNGPSTAPTVAVLVATQDIAIGDPVTPDKVQVKQVDPSAVVGTAIHDTSQVGGQPALIAVPKNSQVSQEVIGGGNQGVPLSAKLKPGEKAIAIQVDRITGLDFLVREGDYVDIVVSQDITVLQPTQDTASKPADQQRFETIPGLTGARTVKTILQDKRVIYVSAVRSTATQPAATASPGTTTQNQQPQTLPDTVVIVIAGTDQDAEVIKFAQNAAGDTGTLTAVLRNTTDTKAETTTGITIDKLVTQYGLPLPKIINSKLQPTP